MRRWKFVRSLDIVPLCKWVAQTRFTFLLRIHGLSRSSNWSLSRLLLLNCISSRANRASFRWADHTLEYRCLKSNYADSSWCTSVTFFLRRYYNGNRLMIRTTPTIRSVLADYLKRPKSHFGQQTNTRSASASSIWKRVFALWGCILSSLELGCSRLLLRLLIICFRRLLIGDWCCDRQRIQNLSSAPDSARKQMALNAIERYPGQTTPKRMLDVQKEKEIGRERSYEY